MGEQIFSIDEEEFAPRPKQDANKFLTKCIGKYNVNWSAYFRRGVLGTVMFKNIVGHDQVVLRLKKAVAKPSHAYVLAGEAGLGKLALAQAFAKALQCDRLDACGQCLSCRVFESGNHPDVLYVKTSKAKGIGVDDVRTQIVLPMSEKPFRYRYKIFIINSPLTPQAQNALLKTIEEPASFGIFLILTEHDKLLLPTVLSRCVTFKLNPLTDEEVAQITGLGTESAAVLFAHGNPQRAIALTESENFEELYRFAQSVASDIQGMALDTVSVFALYSRFEKYKESIQTLLDMLYLCFRGQLPKPSGALTKSNLPAGQTVPLAIDVFRILDDITAAKKALQQNGNFQMTIEMMLLKICQQ